MQELNEQLGNIRESFGFLLPELLLAAGTFVVLLAGLFSKRINLFASLCTLFVALVSLVLIVNSGFEGSHSLFNGFLKRDGFSNFLMLLVDTSVILTSLMSLSDKESEFRSEYYGMILSVAVGGHLLLMSSNLVMVFLSLELISISSYVLAGYSFDKGGSEGSLKYFLFGSVASAIMLYGFSLLYGFTGSFDFTSTGFFENMVEVDSSLLLVAGLMSLSGFLFKMAAVPMQPWAPDVYEAAPMPVIAYLSVAPKLAAIGILTKFVLAMHVYGQGEFDWQLIIAGIALLSITVGNLSALWQKNPKRMMAYSSIAQSGFLLVGVAAFLPEGINFMLFYGAVYLLMNFAVFVFLSYFEKHGFYAMPSYAETGKNHVWAAVGLTVALVALTGLPPTAGFTAKLFIFSGLWEAYQETDKVLLIWLLVFGLINTVISLFFYLRIPYFAFIKAGEPVVAQKKPGFENYLGAILVVLVVVIFFIPGLLMGLINRINFVL